MELQFMELALQEARQAAAANEVPVGAVIVKNGVVIARAQNRVERGGDPTAHAEILAIRAACAATGNKFLQDCTLYVTLEPCAMCAGAIAMARVPHLVFAADDPKGGAVINGGKFFTQPTCHHHPGVMHMESHAAEAGALLKDFFKARR